MELYSYDLPQIFYSLIYNQDLKQGFYTVERAFNNFPKEPDSVVIIILETLKDELVGIKHKLMVKLLIDYYHFLLNCQQTSRQACIPHL